MALTESIEIRVRGKDRWVPSLRVGDHALIVTGVCPRIASIHDEDFTSAGPLAVPEAAIAALRCGPVTADLFTFAQSLTDPEPRYPYRHEWDSVAAVAVATFDGWLSERSTHLRRDLKKSRRAGVDVRLVDFNDDFVHSILSIYNETPVRQGRPFWHYKKPFDAVKKETATYLEQSEFLGAYEAGELIGFLKIVYVGQLARLMFILSRVAHQDKRPTNALIAGAIERCAARGCSHLTYGSFSYSGSGANSLTAFKHRNGFVEIRVPRYYVPLTPLGSVCLRLGLHQGVGRLVPPQVRTRARAWATRLYGAISGECRADARGPAARSAERTADAEPARQEP